MASGLRLRRLRSQARLRDLVRQTQLTPNDMVCPLFVTAGTGICKDVVSMPGVRQLSVDQLGSEINTIEALGIPAVILFGIPSHKDALGSDALSMDGVIARAIAVIKTLAPDLLVIADTCFCEYTEHGHCGVITEDRRAGFIVDNDKTLALLAKQAIVQANAGADIIAPSGMMDGMVSTIREGLDSEGFSNVPILSYAVKYASHFYGPFREAAEGGMAFGDRRGYQMDFANSHECLREANEDVLEGADMLMVKPAGHYLDIIARVKAAHPGIPLGAYQVSGEYAMIKAAAQNGWLDGNLVMMESLTAIKRAGADFIINYFAKDVVAQLERSKG